MDNQHESNNFAKYVSDQNLDEFAQRNILAHQKGVIDPDYLIFNKVPTYEAERIMKKKKEHNHD